MDEAYATLRSRVAVRGGAVRVHDDVAAVATLARADRGEIGPRRHAWVAMGGKVRRHVYDTPAAIDSASE